MTSLKTIDIIKEFPAIYGTPPYDPKESALCFGFECGKGWYPLLHKLSKDINDIVVRDNLTDFRVQQVKEKFGTLRFYTNYGTDEIYKLISDTEKESAITCEQCGAPATLSTQGWWSVECDDCKNKPKQKRNINDISSISDSKEEGL